MNIRKAARQLRTADSAGLMWMLPGGFYFYNREYVAYERPPMSGHAGGVIIDPATRRVALVQDQEGNWGLPKGGKQDTESLPETAARGSREEAGTEVSIVDHLGTKNSRTGSTTYFLMMLNANYGRDNTDSSKVQDVKWLPVPKAFDYLSDVREKDVLRKAQELLKGRPEMR